MVGEAARCAARDHRGGGKVGFSVEYAATIIDANAQTKWQLSPEQVEELKTEAALYAKALGMQSLTERI